MVGRTFSGISVLVLLAVFLRAQTICNPVGPGYVYKPSSGNCVYVPNVVVAVQGSDECAQISAAILQLNATAGGVVDARGFVGSSQSCSNTLTIDRPLVLLLGPAQIAFNGNPGIQITTYEPVKIEGAPWEYNFAPSSIASGTRLFSGMAAPLLQDLSSHGSTLSNVELNGNGIGTVGIFAPSSTSAGGTQGALTFDNVHILNFRYTGIFAPGYATHVRGHLLVNNNGGDGIVMAADEEVEGEQLSYGNGGSGYHIIGGSGRMLQPTTGNNGLYGQYYDGRMPTAWQLSTTYVSPIFIFPTSNNPNSDYFYALAVDKTTGTAQPNWNSLCPSPGDMCSDGAEQWLNVGTMLLDVKIGNVSGITVVGGQNSNNGQTAIAGFVADNIRIEGDGSSNQTCTLNAFLGVEVNDASNLNNPTRGLHIVNCQNTTISNLIAIGGAYNNTIVADDQGQLVVDHSQQTTVTGAILTFCTQSCLQLLSSLNSQISGVVTSASGPNGVSSPYNYMVYVDANSVNNQVSGLGVNIGPYTNARGVYDLGTATSIDNYQTYPSGQGSGFDSLTATVLTNAHNRSVGIPVEFDISGNPVLQMSSSNVSTAASVTITLESAHAGQIACYKAGGQLGYCTSISPTGACTCN